MTKVRVGREKLGKLVCADGNMYEGEWKDDCKEGKGVFVSTNGDKYEGDWVNNEKSGKGSFCIEV